ncbi:hypothetical protein MHI57_10695 [Cytobacillus sp. FSL K6-0129]|uniref:hypothetical protein n=1 Tax=Cytobacillus sp. FSL K6-0129 TaxID=2921421 RepID=UPI0030F748D8
MRIRPKKTNNVAIPVNIYKGEALIRECNSIQEAAHFFKEETNAKKKNWSAINRGIWEGESYSINGATYHFMTDEELVQEKSNK